MEGRRERHKERKKKREKEAFKEIPYVTITSLPFNLWSVDIFNM